MKKRSYLSFALTRFIVALIIAAIIFAITFAIINREFTDSVYMGFEDTGNRFALMLENYATGKYDGTSLKVGLNFYSPDYLRIARIDDDGSLDVIYETDREVITLQKHTNEWIFVTRDEDLLSEGKRHIESTMNNRPVTFDYRKCDEFWSILDDRKNMYGFNTFDLLSRGSENDLFLNAVYVCGYFTAPFIWIDTYDMDDVTLRLGRVIRGDSLGGEFYLDTGNMVSDDALYFTNMRRYPEAFMAQEGKIFQINNINDLKSGDVDPETADNILSQSPYHSSVQNGDLLSQGYFRIVEHDGYTYVLEYVMTTVPFEEFFRPFLIGFALFLLVAAAAVAFIAAIRPYRQHKKAYENVLFRLNMLDALAHGMKAPMKDLEDVAGVLKEDMADASGRILENISRMDSDMDSIVNIAHRQEMVLYETSVRSVIQDVAAKYMADVEIIGDKDIFMDEDYFKIAMGCLIENAVKHKTEDSKIEAVITPSEITIRNNTAAGEFTPGEGIGIARKIIEQLKLKLTTELKDGVFEAKIGKK
ncbi:MAG: HAMP domain-containing histidine kinase [Clostridiales bacterium]|nr:HAMP domain-containing histidine kinase [Clostridiales bacterium]